MRKSMILIMVFLTLASAVSAQRFSGISVENDAQYNRLIEVHANMKSFGEDIDKAKMSVWIPELDVFERSHSFYMRKNINYGRFMYIETPEDAVPDYYLVRVALTHDGKKNYQWRHIYIE